MRRLRRFPQRQPCSRLAGAQNANCPPTYSTPLHEVSRFMFRVSSFPNPMSQKTYFFASVRQNLGKIACPPAPLRAFPGNSSQRRGQHCTIPLISRCFHTSPKPQNPPLFAPRCATSQNSAKNRPSPCATSTLHRDSSRSTKLRPSAPRFTIHDLRFPRPAATP